MLQVPAGRKSAIVELRFGLHFTRDELPEDAATALSAVVRHQSRVHEILVPVVSDSPEPVKAPVLRVSRRNAAPLRVNVFATDGRPLCSANLDLAVLAPRQDGPDPQRVALRASPSFRGAPPSEIIFEARPVPAAR